MFCGLLKAEASNRGSHRVPERFDWQGAGSEAACCLLPSTYWLKVLFYKCFLKINIIKISDMSTKNFNKCESIVCFVLICISQYFSSVGSRSLAFFLNSFSTLINSARVRYSLCTWANPVSGLAIMLHSL